VRVDPLAGDLFGDAPPLPDGLVFDAAFLKPDEEAALLAWIATLPLHEAQYKEYTARRRVASFGSSYDFANNRLKPAPPVPDVLHPLRARAAAWAGVPEVDFANALVAEYRPGTPLGWHRDVPDHELVFGVSLGGSAVMRLRRWPPVARAPTLELELPPRSAYLLRDEARWAWQHAIAPTRELRYSITLRTPRVRGAAPAR
jgi:alkylated DNA repair dioxygenase AlkB